MPTLPNVLHNVAMLVRILPKATERPVLVEDCDSYLDDNDSWMNGALLRTDLLSKVRLGQVPRLGRCTMIAYSTKTENRSAA